jgi:hypothetical protein
VFPVRYELNFYTGILFRCNSVFKGLILLFNSVLNGEPKIGADLHK